MDWRESVLDYCERLDGRFWAEPLNAMSNASFLIAAAAAFALVRKRGQSDPPAMFLIATTACVGVGSFVFHTVATRGAMLLDVLPIAVFIYGYILLALRRFFSLGLVVSIVVTALFAAGNVLVSNVKALNGSLAYLPALTSLIVFSALLSRRRDLRDRETARGLGLSAALFVLSLTFRTIDRGICAAFPTGTHFIWHIINGCLLWLLLRTAILAKPATGLSQATPSQKARAPTTA